MKNIKLKITLISIAVCFVLSGCNLDKRYERTVEMPLSISDGQKLIISTDVGSIKIIGKDVQDGNIKAKITGKGDTVEKAQKVAEDINITVENNKDTVVIKINKSVGIKSEWYETDFTIEVPKNIGLEAKTDVGSITISDIKSDIDASCDVGSIDCKNVCGKANLKTDVGHISLDYDPNADSKVHAELSVDVGSINFTGPKNMSAKLNVSTDVGSIHSDLPITIKGNIRKNNLNGTVGQGEGAVRLKTDVGSINIK